MNLHRFLIIFSLLSGNLLFGAPLDQTTQVRVTHGPILGRPGTDSMSIWARTNEPGDVTIFYGKDEESLDMVSPVLKTELNHDNTGVATLSGLESNTRYYYRIEDHQLSGSFQTLPDSAEFKNEEGNPEGPGPGLTPPASCLAAARRATPPRRRSHVRRLPRFVSDRVRGASRRRGPRTAAAQRFASVSSTQAGTISVALP